jgi:hypothetical protein
MKSPPYRAGFRNRFEKESRARTRRSRHLEMGMMVAMAADQHEASVYRMLPGTNLFSPEAIRGKAPALFSVLLCFR